MHCGFQECTELEDILPKAYLYKVLSIDPVSDKGFDCTFRVNLFTEEQVHHWLKAFECSSYVNFRVTRTAPGKRTRIIFKKYYRCHHNTRASEQASKTKKPHTKHTGCEATLLITVNNTHMKRCKDPDLRQYPCIVRYHNFHNHVLTCDQLPHRKPLRHIEQKIHDLLARNHNPASALRILKQDLLGESRNQKPDTLEDGSIRSKLKWMYQKYCKIFKNLYPNHEELPSASDLMTEETYERIFESEINQPEIEMAQRFSQEYILPCEPEHFFLSEIIDSNEDN